MIFNELDSSNEKLKANIILAAGGIVWNNTSGGPQIAVIHRARYGDWCLPKGKPDPDKNETLEEVAIREVKEETGCDARIINFAGETRYEVNGIPKVVYYWNMEVKGECTFKPSEEVDQLLWMLPQEAIKNLDHSEERNLLLASYNEKRTP